MTISVGQSIAIIAVCAACTFLERWLPWLLFGRRAVPKVVEYLGKILPMAVMVSLLVYCLRSATEATSLAISAAVCGFGSFTVT